MTGHCTVPAGAWASRLILQHHTLPASAAAMPAAKWPIARTLAAAQNPHARSLRGILRTRWYHMDTQIVWGYVILLLPLIVAVALVPACWVRDRFVPSAQKSQWLEPRWVAQPHRHVLECSHPVLLEALTGCLNRRDPYIPNSKSRS